MDKPHVSEITQILEEWNNGDDQARERLLPYVYDELRRQARFLMMSERPDHTLQPTALVHEAFMRLSAQTGIEWRDRSHFYGFASRTMRQVLVDHARRLATNKRGNRPLRFSIDDVQIPVEDRAEAIVAIHEALERLEQFDPQQGEVVAMRFFGGLSNREISEALGISERTVNRDWDAARLWLFRELNQK
jgi:RNA polymerase sigma-70 factor, ECF subfamily